MTSDLDLVRESLPAYDVGGEIGRGGWGVVLSGRHRVLDRPVAIKQLPPAFAADPGVRRRFTAEGRLLASLDHPHVVPVYDFVEHDGLCLLVMELLPGGTVWSRFTTVGFNAHSAVAVALAGAAGLTAAHHHGILHRDVKPENLMFAASGAVKVTDFGIAKVVGGDETLATRTGDVLGTPSYIAPEQARGNELSPATDVYALATMLYELLSGALPFPAGDSAMAVLFMHAFDDPTPLREAAPLVPDSIAEVVMRGLATDPGARYATAEEFGIALAGASTGRWGPGWLAAEGIPVMGADSIVTAAGLGRVAGPTPSGDEEPPLPMTRPHGGACREAEAATAQPTAPSAPAGDTVTARSTAAGGPADTRAAPGPTAPAGPATAGRTVRPSITVHTRGARLVDVANTDLVPVRSVFTVPPAKVPVLVSVGLAVLALLVAVVGLGSPAVSPPPPGAVTVAGADPAVVDPVPLDLAATAPVTVAAPVAGDTATVTLSVLGIPVARRSAPLIPGAPAVATVPALGGGYLVAGDLTGEVALSQGGQSTQSWSFPVRTTQRAITTAVAVATAAVLLFAFAYVESFLRSLRRGRARISAMAGTPVVSALAGVGVVAASWVLLGRQPTVATVIVSAGLAAGAGLAAAIGAERMGRLRRYRRAVRAGRRVPVA
ncbi:hypothetical protein GCM10023094_40670 [Rhodococcus olei]|uniref:non-specific serine/threonine protein kinase n=1 Tax=Rhodococcus olei TaxID=2161675 RepID=A0ABP8PEV2_9NOCA